MSQRERAPGDAPIGNSLRRGVKPLSITFPPLKQKGNDDEKTMLFERGKKGEA
jgi:hypothetical protein